PLRASTYVVYAVGSVVSRPIRVTAYAARAAPDGIGTATALTSNDPTPSAARPASRSASPNASAGASVAGAGPRAARVGDEVTRTAAPLLTMMATRPPRPARRSPNRWRSGTTEPAPIGRASSTSIAATADSSRPNRSRFWTRYCRAAVTGSAASAV